MSLRCFLPALLLCLAAAGPAPVAAGAAALFADSGEIQERAASYVAGYQRQLTAIVADELYTQEIRAQVPEDADAPKSRTLRSEVFFLFAAEEREWMAIRD